MSLRGAGIHGKALDIVADVRQRQRRPVRPQVFVGDGQETVIGYDTAAQELYVDRTRSGRRELPPAIRQRQPGTPGAAAQPARLKLRILWTTPRWRSSRTGPRGVITDQVFPGATSDRVQLFAEGGTARVGLGEDLADGVDLVAWHSAVSMAL